MAGPVEHLPNYPTNPPVTRLIGLSGSLRQGSYNTALLHAAATLLPAGVTLTVKTLHGIPLYNGDDEEATGIPAIVQELKRSIVEADGLILSTPEYNHSIPGVFKNAIDWLSRPGDDIPRVFGGKPVALIGATPGSFGTVLSQNAWLPILHTFGTKPWFGGRLGLSQAYKAFNPAGQLIDADGRIQLQKFVAGFVQFADGERNLKGAAS
jgi:NAD(P)H-dependent FMN reductase